MASTTIIEYSVIPSTLLSWLVEQTPIDFPTNNDTKEENVDGGEIIQ